MHLRVFAIVISLVCETIRTSSGVGQKRRAHRETSEDCRTCLECSRDNGCVRCPEKLFLFLQRAGMSHHGSCLHACPAGHYGQRGKDVNRCMKCRSLECEQCFSRDFCTKCKPGLQMYKGKCLTSCPEGTRAHEADCTDDCAGAPLRAWSEWSACLRDGVRCGFRWGKRTRTRGRTPEEQAAPRCPPHSETQKCRMRKKCATAAEEAVASLGERSDEEATPTVDPRLQRRRGPAATPFTVTTGRVGAGSSPSANDRFSPTVGESVSLISTERSKSQKGGLGRRRERKRQRLHSSSVGNRQNGTAEREGPEAGADAA